MPVKEKNVDELIVSHPGLVWLDFVGDELVGIYGAVVHDRYDPGKIDRIIRDYNERRSNQSSPDAEG